MSVKLWQGDICQLPVDAIVNAANTGLLGGGGVDGAIHAAAGPELDKACRPLAPCPTGEARLTPGFRLPAKFIIHTVGPVWHGGQQGEEELLRQAYRSSLALAAEQGFESVAFPLISGGVYGYPKREAIRIALEELQHFTASHQQPSELTLVLYDAESYELALSVEAQRETFADRYRRWNDFMCQNLTFNFAESQIHTTAHCARVLFHALLLGEARELADDELEALAAASVFHDTRRLDDHRDVGHGARAAQYYQEYCSAHALKLDPRTVQMMAFHDQPDEDGYAFIEADPALRDHHGRLLYQIFKDSDGLDRLRIGSWALDTKQLRSELSLSLLPFAQELIDLGPEALLKKYKNLSGKELFEKVSRPGIRS